MNNTVKDQSIRAGVSERFMLEIIEHSGATPIDVADACGRYSSPETAMRSLREKMRGLQQTEIMARCVGLFGDSGVFIASWIIASR